MMKSVSGAVSRPRGSKAWPQIGHSITAIGTSASQAGQVLVGGSPSPGWLSRSTSCSRQPWICEEVPKSSTMQSRLTMPGCSTGSTVRSPRPTIWIMVHLKELGRSRMTQEVGG